MKDRERGIPDTAREREKRREKSKGEDRGWVHECDLGNGFCFQERLGFDAEHFTTDCAVRHALSASLPLTLADAEIPALSTHPHITQKAL